MQNVLGPGLGFCFVVVDFIPQLFRTYQNESQILGSLNIHGLIQPGFPQTRHMANLVAKDPCR